MPCHSADRPVPQQDTGLAELLPPIYAPSLRTQMMIVHHVDYNSGQRLIVHGQLQESTLTPRKSMYCDVPFTLFVPSLLPIYPTPSGHAFVPVTASGRAYSAAGVDLETTFKHVVRDVPYPFERLYIPSYAALSIIIINRPHVLRQSLSSTVPIRVRVRHLTTCCC